MPKRQRTIKPEYFEDSLIAELNLATRYLYISLWGLMDRQGIFECDPKLLKKHVFNYDDAITIDHVIAMIDELVSHGRILLTVAPSDSVVTGARRLRKRKHENIARDSSRVSNELAEVIAKDSTNSEDYSSGLHEIAGVTARYSTKIFGFCPKFIDHQVPRDDEPVVYSIPLEAFKCVKYAVIAQYSTTVTVPLLRTTLELGNGRLDIYPTQTSSSREIGTDLADKIDRFVELWNSILHPAGFAKVLKLGTRRKKSINARLKDEPSLEYWTSVMERLKQSPFLRGENRDGWKATLDWLLQTDAHIKVMEGNYDGKKTEHGKDYSTSEVVFIGSTNPQQ